MAAWEAWPGARAHPRQGFGPSITQVLLGGRESGRLEARSLASPAKQRHGRYQLGWQCFKTPSTLVLVLVLGAWRCLGSLPALAGAGGCGEGTEDVDTT